MRFHRPRSCDYETHVFISFQRQRNEFREKVNTFPVRQTRTDDDRNLLLATSFSAATITAITAIFAPFLSNIGGLIGRSHWGDSQHSLQLLSDLQAQKVLGMRLNINDLASFQE